uniref:Synaptogyrin 3 n=1 Tax=Pundamilia nyererei TaxID=303518 RepID=A0A3B4GVG5_9CICH
MDGVGSFGAGRSGSTIDPITFAKQPQTILRVLSWIFSLVVFASIVNEGYVNMGSERLHCIFNKNTDACNYGVFVGLVGLLACSFFFLLDYKFSSISSVKDRKKAVMLEIGFSGFWTFLYFVSFCFLANQWSRTRAEELPLNQGADAARAAIAFSFFSIITWIVPMPTMSVCSSVCAVLRVHALISESVVSCGVCATVRVCPRAPSSCTRDV